MFKIIFAIHRRRQRTEVGRGNVPIGYRLPFLFFRNRLWSTSNWLVNIWYKICSIQSLVQFLILHTERHASWSKKQTITLCSCLPIFSTWKRLWFSGIYNLLVSVDEHMIWQIRSLQDNLNTIITNRSSNSTVHIDLKPPFLGFWIRLLEENIQRPCTISVYIVYVFTWNISVAVRKTAAYSYNA